MTAPRNPYLVLAAAILLPGFGHVLLGLAQRGLMFLFFIVILGWASRNAMPSDFTFVGKHIGGIFIYGMSVLDAYKIARVRFVEWTHAQNNSSHD
jgi:hypothetical protein